MKINQGKFRCRKVNVYIYPTGESEPGMDAPRSRSWAGATRELIKYKMLILDSPARAKGKHSRGRTSEF